MAQVQVTRAITATNLLRTYYPNGVYQITEESYSLGWSESNNEYQVAFKLASFPSEYANKALRGFTFSITSYPYTSIDTLCQLWTLGAYSPSTLSWNTRPTPTQVIYRYITTFSSGTGRTFTFDGSTDSAGALLLARASGVLFASLAQNYAMRLYMPAASAAANRPTLTFIVDDAVTVDSQVVQKNCPTGGHVDRNSDVTFSWIYEASGNVCAGDFTQSIASVYWKLHSDTNYTRVQASGSTQSVTIPAGTFPAGKIDWYIHAKDTNGHFSTSPVYSFSTSDATTYAYPVSPVGEIVDGSAPIAFTVRHENAYGSAATRTGIVWSTDGSTWTSLGAVTGSGDTLSVEGGTFPSGTIYWKARSNNLDGVTGPYSSPVSFICYAAPDPPAVNATDVPWSTISWVSSDQQAFRVTVDGKSYGTVFGTAKKFTLPEPLEPGDHVAQVEVQNIYGLWSAPGETGFTVTNYDGPAYVTLSADFGAYQTTLSWSTTAASRDFYIYRDGVLVARTNQLSWSDRESAGTHSYFIRDRLTNSSPKGRYIQSNTVTGGHDITETVIGPLSDGLWLSLRLSPMSSSEQTFSFSRTYAARHVAGSVYPVLELSPFEDESASFMTAFTDWADVQSFEALRGQIVVVKSRGNNVIIGLLAQVEKVVGDFYTTFSFTIQRIHREEFVDVSDG